ncbi:MAG: rhomboid family intramembrane serine protease [Clostridiales bacterium]|nr:rhomboid family intramembrane serine protease [Clostridiales bacterium]
MKKIFNRANESLKNSGYDFMFAGTLSNGVKAAFCFGKFKGAVLNIVVLIDGYLDPLGSCFEEVCLKALERRGKGIKVSCLGILIGGREEIFLTQNDFDPMADSVKIRWAYNEEDKTLRCGKGSPDKFDGVESIFGKEEKAVVPKKSLLRVNKPLITYILILANLLMFAVLTLDGGSENTDTLLKYGAIYAPYIKNGEFYRLFTYMFLHIGVIHLFANMFGLYIFGTRCEKYFGYLGFAVIYFLSGLGCSVLSFLLSEGSVSAGASGAIFGIMAAALTYSGINKIKMDGLDAYVFVLIAIINIGFGFVYSGIDNAGHIGGFLTGLVLGSALGFWDKKRALKNEKAL